MTFTDEDLDRMANMTLRGGETQETIARLAAALLACRERVKRGLLRKNRPVSNPFQIVPSVMLRLRQQIDPLAGHHVSRPKKPQTASTLRPRPGSCKSMAWVCSGVWYGVLSGEGPGLQVLLTGYPNSLWRA